MKKKQQGNKHFRFITSIIVAVTAFIFCLLPIICLAATPPPIEQVIEKLQETYDGINSFQAYFVQETTVKSIKKTDREEGNVYLKKPKNMFWNYTKPKAKKLIINASKTWLYLPGDKVAYIQESDLIFRSKILIKFLSGLGKLKDDFIIKYDEPRALDDKENYILSLAPREKNAGLNDFQLLVDKKTNYIVRISFDDTMGNYTVLNFSHIVINGLLADKMFQFKPPAGVSIYNMP